MKKYFQYIRQLPCWFGGKELYFLGYPRFCSQDWDEQRGEFKSEVSHILRKGSTRRNDHLGNVFPNCRIHHHWFEGLTPEVRESFLVYGKEIYEEYLKILD